MTLAEMLRHDPVQPDLAAHHRSRDEVGAGLDAIRDHAVFRAVQFLHAFDDDAPRAGALDLRAHLVEEIREIHDLRLGGGAVDDGRALGEHRGHHHVVRTEDGGALFAAEVHLRATEFARKNLHIAVLDAVHRAQRLEALEVKVDRPIADHAAAGKRNDRLLLPAEQRPKHADGCAHFPHNLVGSLRLDVLRLDPDRAAGALHTRAEMREDLEHVVDVREVGHVGDRARLLREKGRSEDGQRAVFAAGDADASVELVAAVHENFIHGS